MKKLICVLMMCFGFGMLLTGCDDSDLKQTRMQEKLLQQSVDQIGMPNIVNFREKKLMKEILELRDQDGLITYTYVYSQFKDKFRFVGKTIGYPIPAATQFTSPQKLAGAGHVIPQADPNGMFSPASAEGTWIMMWDEKAQKARPQYIEERVSCFTMELPDNMVSK